MNDAEVVLITGASSGMGYDTAKILASQGYKVYACARRLELMESLKEFGITPLKLDVTVEDNVVEVVNQIKNENGKIDILINCAGYGLFGPIETVELKEAIDEMNVNLFSVARMIKEVLPIMKEKHSGRIINVGSIAGKSYLYFGGWYHASKYALEGFTDSLRLELKPFGIKVVLIEPGSFATNWGKIARNHVYKNTVCTDYEAEGKIIADAYDAVFSKKGFIAKDPYLAAKKIAKAATKKHPKTRYCFGRFSKMLIWFKALAPTRLYDYMVVNVFKGRIAKRYINKKNSKKD